MERSKVVPDSIAQFVTVKKKKILDEFGVPVVSLEVIDTLDYNKELGHGKLLSED